MELGETLKNNGKRHDTINIRINGEDSSIVPAVYLEEFFKMYDAGGYGYGGMHKRHRGIKERMGVFGANGTVCRQTP